MPFSVIQSFLLFSSLGFGMPVNADQLPFLIFLSIFSLPIKLEPFTGYLTGGPTIFQVDLQPQLNYNFYTQIYFVVFIVLGAFFILNLFIGVIIDNFNRLKQQYEDGIGIFLTPGQRNWVNTLKSASGKKPTRRLTRPTVSRLDPFYHRTSFRLILSSRIAAHLPTHVKESGKYHPRTLCNSLVIFHFIHFSFSTHGNPVNLKGLLYRGPCKTLQIKNFITKL